MSEDKEPTLDDPEFRAWIIENAKNTDPMVMLEDCYFISRLLNSVATGRSTKFNQQESEGGKNSALMLLKKEYVEYKKRLGG
jgi:hypothetical protein